MISADLRINDRIRSGKIRLVGENGEQLGIVDIGSALARAQDLDLDLVEVAPQADPPVCKIMDYGKWKYEQDVRAKEARRKQSQIKVREMRLRPKISSHDYDTKRRHVERFLTEGSKVKIAVWFKGREMAHTELGARLLERMSAELSEIAAVEVAPKLDGRNMVMVLSPLRKQVKPSKHPEPEPTGG